MLNFKKRTDFTNNETDLDVDLTADTCDRLPIKITFTLSFTVLLTALTLSFLLAGLGDASLITSWGVCLLCSVVIFITSKRIFQAIWKVLGLALSVSFFGYPIIPALIFGGIISTGAYSALIASAKGRGILIPVFLPAFAYTISLAISGDPLISLISLLIFLPAIPMGFTSRKSAGMTTSIVSASAIMLAIIAGIAALALWVFYGEVSAAAIDSAIKDITFLFLKYTEETFLQMSEMGYEGLEFTESMQKELTLGIETYFNSAIGIVMALCTIASYAAIRTQHALFDSYGLDHLTTPEATTVTVSVAGAAIFSISHVLSFSLDSSNNLSVVGVVCGNICLALTPGLALMGFRAVKELPRRLGGLGAILSILLVIVILFLTFTFPTFIAIVGAVYVVAMAIDAWAKKFYSKGDNQ